ncbi:calcium-dependent protein kinase 26 isoform X1 [Coffea arabica]|uniref:non-specific serine/threonine protein kinase n=2 Tax=Coffea arabica TaxID=13443 RepID=A0A6P6W4T7_COFAR|nr:calcium-dependent protein kinase 26-like [Coffea arabica]
MAVAKCNGITENSPFLFKCYRVGSLTETILDTQQTSNLKDRYVLGGQLGWGQFGIIRECSDKLTGELLACKSIAKDRLVTHEDVRSIKLEIEIMTRLSGHPNVVDLKAAYEDENYVHLVMELCAGGELFNQLEKHGKFSEAEAKVIFRHLMEVVMYCHDKGVVHRDLKPENILLATKALSSPIKLADFGLATYIKQGQSLHGTVGSPFYIAPEVLIGGYDQAADVWSAGVILYILLSGIPPFWGKTKSRIFDAVRLADLQFPSNPWDYISYTAQELVRGMLCKDPSQRLSAQQVLDHTWLMDSSPLSEQPYECLKQSYGDGDLQRDPFSSSLMARNQDISFRTGLSISSDVQSPTFTCRSALSSFLVTPSTPYYKAIGFSFQSSGGSNSVDFPIAVVSMPSFAFNSPDRVAGQGNPELDLSVDLPRVDSLHQDASLRALLKLPDPSLCYGHADCKVADPTRGGSIGSKMSGIHNRRNNTISLGELEQLDLIVTESVIRWASCAHLPTAMSLRSSLVC